MLLYWSQSQQVLCMQMLGLNADKYVPDPEALWQAHKGWHRAISSEACSRLAALWEEAIREPLLATVDRNPSYPPSADIFPPPMAGAIGELYLAVVLHCARCHFRGLYRFVAVRV